MLSRKKLISTSCALLGLVTVTLMFSPKTAPKVVHDTQSHDAGVSYELLQVVSSTDDTLHPGLRRLPIETVHRQGLPHRGSIVFVLNERNEVLLLKRAPSMKTCPSTWSIVGEHSEPNEDYMETARRGLSEELSLNSTAVRRVGPVWDGPLRLRIEYDNKRVDDQWTMFYFAVVAAGALTTVSEEASATMLLPLAQVPARRQLLGCKNMRRFQAAHRAAPAQLRETTYPDLLSEGAMIVQNRLLSLQADL
mmetsp:Transcript_9300/g.19169  ORF Transcript_9300/g.19169 Transcript_9300/m.19169 type:complete len:250 (-) Transcript_9300:163-912(-)